jgi:hypothetical protein
MILKRVSESLKRQDWTMVAIEFVLVVVGVLLAFQINDWASARSEARARRAATERLLEESERDIAHVKEGIGFMQKLVDDLHFALGKVVSGSWSPADERRMRNGFSNGRYMTAMVPPTSVYDDIVASGGFNSIGTPEVRAKISAFHATLAYDERTRQQFLPILRAFEDIPAFTYRVDPLAKKPIKLTVDFHALAKDPAAQRHIALTAADQAGLLWIRKRALSDAVSMCEALAQSLDRKCDQNRPLPVFN